MLSSTSTLSLTLGLFLVSASYAASQDLLNTGILDGSWDITRYYYSDTANIANNGVGTHCGKQEHINLKVDGNSFVQDSSVKDVTFGTSGIWEIESLESISENTNHTLEPELDPLYLKFRAFKDALSPLDLCAAVQVIAPSSSASSASSDRTELFMMVNTTNPRLCPAPWIRFGGVCAQGVDFLTGKCISGPCLDKLKDQHATATNTVTSTVQSHPTEGAKKNGGSLIGAIPKVAHALASMAVTVLV
ncbi:hypothetical protein EMPS_05117 [Entomortierella parvispora]|uniref:Uncharacterized protein n=1 Tax=Entomortierella parvispora TaxID=205924 RepID=A0A9P3LW79_9FUNG|nr:hypothetical protein EMPS_05117 [Entomortierella parvispora]